jgi:hypothetical protein
MQQQVRSLSRPSLAALFFRRQRRPPHQHHPVRHFRRLRGCARRLLCPFCYLRQRLTFCVPNLHKDKQRPQQRRPPRVFVVVGHWPWPCPDRPHRQVRHGAAAQSLPPHVTDPREMAAWQA